MEKKEYTDEEIREHFFNLFDQMPDDYAILAKLRYDHEWASHSFEYHRTAIDNAYRALNLGFGWDETPEKGGFWDCVYEAAARIAVPYPTIPEPSMREIEQFKSDRDALPAEHSPAYISISPSEYRELKEKADKYDAIMEVLK